MMFYNKTKNRPQMKSGGDKVQQKGQKIISERRYTIITFVVPK